MFKIRAFLFRTTMFTRSCARVCNKLSWPHHVCKRGDLSLKSSFTSLFFIEVSVPQQEGERPCIILYVCKKGYLSSNASFTRHFSLTFLYQDWKVSGHVYVLGESFCDLSIEFMNYSDSLCGFFVCFVFHLTSYNKLIYIQ